ncbi:glycoside hydrolase family 15 protein [Georgenia wangjunii]|uniref:glycoside hydrolase family 15 protein n=1 Tax=Georgenia wangjunii TaxID=3117730 RepID=UPI002F26407E
MTSPAPTPVEALSSSPALIEDYAVLGDAHTVALVSREGSMDWLCFPGLDSEAFFAALLGTPDHGRWLLTATGEDVQVERRYVGDSFELETTYTTPTGTARVVEAMPTANGRHDVVRRVVGVEGTVSFAHDWVVRWDYGQTKPWIYRAADTDGEEVLRAISGPDALTLHAHRLPRATGGRHQDRFDVAAGETFDFVLTWTPSWEPIPGWLDVDAALAATRERWASWAQANTYDGPYRDAVVRSLLVLRLLTQETTGGIAAAATTSLPEEMGGERNWDYRYCWLRDAALTLEALLELGYRGEAEKWRAWLLRAVAGEPDKVQIMYRLDGSRDLPELEVDGLPGYEGSRPVRIGNGAVDQDQNDVLGEVMLALDLARRSGLAESRQAWNLQRRLVEGMLEHWREPDHGIWEVRGPKRHFVHSKVMCWAVLDCAIRAVEDEGLDGPVELWREVREEIHAEVLEKGYDPELGSFVQYYGADHTDASLLQLVQVGFLPPDDERLHGTVERIRAELADGPWVLRYRTETGVDGLAGDEHPFLACCFWLVDALARTGQVAEATTHMEQLLAVVNDVGLLSEEYDQHARRFTGNYPQAFSHLTLVRAAHSLQSAASGERPLGAHVEPGKAAPGDDVHAPSFAQDEHDAGS